MRSVVLRRRHQNFCCRHASPESFLARRSAVTTVVPRTIQNITIQNIKLVSLWIIVNACDRFIRSWLPRLYSLCRCFDKMHRGGIFGGLSSQGGVGPTKGGVEH